MPLCGYCTMRQHWQGEFALHWPLVHDPVGLKERLGKAEMEKKREAEAAAVQRRDPHFRSPYDLEDLRRFKLEAARVHDNNMVGVGVGSPHSLTTTTTTTTMATTMATTTNTNTNTSTASLARYYMYAETPVSIYFACHLPTGYTDKHLDVRISGANLTVQVEDSPPLIAGQALGGPLPPYPSLHVIRSEDNRLALIHIPKTSPVRPRRPGGSSSSSRHPYHYHSRSETGTSAASDLVGDDLGDLAPWHRLFREGEPGFRHLEPPYRLARTSTTSLMMLVSVPFWVLEEDIRVDISGTGIEVEVRDGTQHAVTLKRTFATHPDAARRQGADYAGPVDPTMCSWTLDDDDDDDDDDEVNVNVNVDAWMAEQVGVRSGGK